MAVEWERAVEGSLVKVSIRDPNFRELAGGYPAPTLTLSVPDELVEQIVERAAVIALERLRAEGAAAPSPYLTVAEAAEYVRAKPQRIYDLLSKRRLTRFKDGRRTLVSRAEMNAYLAGERLRSVAPALPPPPRKRMPRGLVA